MARRGNESIGVEIGLAQTETENRFLVYINRLWSVVFSARTGRWLPYTSSSARIHLCPIEQKSGAAQRSHLDLEPEILSIGYLCLPPPPFPPWLPCSCPRSFRVGVLCLQMPHT